jgi:hypothetical protein
VLEEIVENIRVMCDYKINPLAVLNILQAKLNYVFSLKDVKFKSIQNVSIPRTLAYYAFNFIPSGGMKNLPLRLIDNHIIDFANDYLIQYNNERINELENEQLKEGELIEKSELKRKKQEWELELKKERERNLTMTLTNSTQAKIYDYLEVIQNMGYGAICIENTEFALYFQDALKNRDKIKKEFLDMLYNLYDGEFQGTDTVTTARSSVSNIPTTLILASDYDLLSKDKLKDDFLGYLKRGMARRSFIYFDNKENFYLQNKPEYPSYEMKQDAVDNLKFFGAKIKNIFDSLELHKEFCFNQEANNEIIKYKMQLDERIAEFYRFTDILDLKNDILKLNLEHSTWKIIKLAVLYHILETGGASTLIKADSFYKAIEFFNKTHKCLEILLGVKEMSDYEKLYNFLIKNCNKWISRMELRSQQFVPNAQFKNWIEDALIAVSEIAEIKSFCLARRASGRSNQGVEIALYAVIKYKFDSKQDGGVIKGELVKRDNKDLYTKEI